MNQFLNELNKNGSPNPEDRVFAGIWKKYENVILHSLLTTFGLDFIVHDQYGGDVDTVHNVRESGTFKNKEYEKRYKARDEYDPNKYHNDTTYSQTVSEARKEFIQSKKTIEDAYVPGNRLFFTKSTGVGTDQKANLDHVIATHTIDNDPVRFLTDLDAVSLANDPENLRFTNEFLNKQMKDMSIEEFIRWRADKGEPLPDEVIERLRAEDARAWEHYESTISEAYYTSPQFYEDLTVAAGKRGLEMGARQTLGLILMEIWFTCKAEVMNIRPGCGFKECFNAIRKGIAKGIDNVAKKYKDLVSEFLKGFGAGVLSSLTTSLCNIFFTTEKNLVRLIRYSYASIIQAGTIILINPDNLFLGDQLKSASIILATGASTIVGSIAGDAIAKTPIGAAPYVGKPLVQFSSVLTSGLLSCSFLIMLDRSKLINDVIGKMNEYATEEYNLALLSRRFSDLAAGLTKIDFDAFSEECLRFNNMSYTIRLARSEEELDGILNSIYEKEGFENPWEGDFDEFMSNGRAPLSFV